MTKTKEGFKNYYSPPVDFKPENALSKVLTYYLDIDHQKLKDGPISYQFHLIQQNNVYNELISQMGSNKTFQDFVEPKFSKAQIAVIKKNINDSITAAFTDPTINNIDKVLSFFNKKEAGESFTPAEEKTAMNALASDADVDKIATAMINNTNVIIADLKNEVSAKWLLQFAWIINPKTLTANPLAFESVDESALEQLNADLITANKELNIKSLEVSLIENRSKVTGTSANDTQELLNTYTSKLIEKQSAENKVAGIQSKIKGIKGASAEISAKLSKTKSLLLKDSLLYNGTFFLNDKDFLNINKADRAFMRHHDAKNDFHLMETTVIRQVNERQRMYILVENADKSKGFKLKTTIEAIQPKNDLDLLSAQTAGVLASPDKVEGLYTIFVELKRLTDPYTNGVLLLPFDAIRDETPNFETRIVSHEVQADAPSLVKYAITDSLTSKNLNSEETVYQYRQNKLYRFRFKAGIAYSSLERRRYTIDAAANTATYTTERAGLGATVGLQIFPVRLDIQKPGFLPGGLSPFVYLGYQISDAPVNNFLIGGGFEIFSGLAINGGAHFAKTEHLSSDNSGILKTVNYYECKWFLGASVGLEAFAAFFNKIKPVNVNPFIK